MSGQIAAGRGRMHTARDRILGGVERGLLLRLADVLLVADALVAEPVAHLAHADAALACQLLFGLLARVRIAQMRVEVGVEYLLGLFGEVAAFAARVQEPRAQHHDELARALLELHLNRAEVLAYDRDHAVDLARRDRSRVALLAQQLDRVRRELVARLLVSTHLFVVELSYDTKMKKITH